MNSIVASNINSEAVLNQQVADGSKSSLLLSSINFSLTEMKSNFTPSSNQGRCLIKLSRKEQLLNGQHKSLIGHSIVTVNGSKEKSSEDCIPVPKIQLFAGKIYTEWRQVYKIGAGLINLGNTCFMNTVIQCLTYCPPLANYLLHDKDHSSKCSTTGFCMMCLLQRHLRRTIGKTGQVIKPNDIYQRLKSIAQHFQFGRQEDAHEFLRYVIDHLWKACIPQTNGLSKLDSTSKETTVINTIFGGYHRSQVICLKCKKESNTFDHFMDFILDIKQNVTSLEKALEKFIQPELLQQENCYKCPKCKIKVEAKKQFSVYRTPQVATFQLKRFDYSRAFGRKITKQISYPEKLNLRPYMSENKGEPVWYRLNAVLVHSGPFCNSGHYYCYVKNSNGLWYIMDDQRVHQVSSNQVMNESAYVLFYIKMMGRAKTPSPKCVEVKHSYSKAEIATKPNKYFEKSITTKTSSLDSEAQFGKATPLSEKVNVAKSSSPVSSSNALHKSNSFSTPARENVSIGFRPGLSPNAFLPATKTTFGCQPPPVITSPGGLVPYNEDSSDSSDREGTLTQSIGEKQPSSQGNSVVIKAKRSISVNNPSLHLVTPKVNVSGNWIASNATETASCISNNSLSDWKVTAIDDSCQPPGSNKNRNSKTSNSINSPKLQTDKDFRLSLNLSSKGKDSCLPTDFCNQSDFQSNHFENSNVRKRYGSNSMTEMHVVNHERSENGYFPSPKKTKFLEKPSHPVLENGVRHSSWQNKWSDSITSPHKTVSTSDSHRQINGVSDSYEKSKGLWTHKNIFSSHHSSKGKKDLGDPLKVPTWKNESYRRSSIVTDYECKQSVDEFDEEFDRGKVRKSKRKDHYRSFHRGNPFQKHPESNQRHYNGKYYNSNHYYHRKPYHSHSNWKSKHSSYHRDRNHHQRYY